MRVALADGYNRILKQVNLLNVSRGVVSKSEFGSSDPEVDPVYPVDSVRLAQDCPCVGHGQSVRAGLHHTCLPVKVLRWWIRVVRTYCTCEAPVRISTNFDNRANSQGCEWCRGWRRVQRSVL